MAKSFNFDDRSARRISRAVRGYETRPTDLTRGRGRPQILSSGNILLYEILDRWLTWDDDVGAYKIQARIVPEEGAEGVFFDVDSVSEKEKEWLWVPRETSCDNGENAGLPTVTRYLRVYGVLRNDRREILFPGGYLPNHWFRGNVAYPAPCPPGGIVGLPFRGASPSDIQQYGYYWPESEFAIHTLYTEAPAATDDTLYTLARQASAWGAIAEGMGAAVLYRDGFWDSSSWGPCKGSWYLWPGMPGFAVQHRVLASHDVDGLILVKSYKEGVYCARAISWATNQYPFPGSSADGDGYYITANPMTRDEEFVYDGGTYHGITVPNMQIRIYIPAVCTRQNNKIKEPNVQAGDRIWYSVANSCHDQQWSGYAEITQIMFFAAGDYLDDKIGTVKLINYSSLIPRGWEFHEEMNDEFPSAYALFIIRAE